MITLEKCFICFLRLSGNGLGIVTCPLKLTSLQTSSTCLRGRKVHGLINLEYGCNQASVVTERRERVGTSIIVRCVVSDASTTSQSNLQVEDHKRT